MLVQLNLGLLSLLLSGLLGFAQSLVFLKKLSDFVLSNVFLLVNLLVVRLILLRGVLFEAAPLVF